jgi:hypothetical protein
MVPYTQADAIVLEGGYVLFLVFRGDNTTPIFKKEFSPLHNRCLVLLSKLLKDGGEGYWDNLYPSLDVAQEVAKGGTYSAKVPAGPCVGETETITVPETGTCGTARTNRGVPAACRQPDKKGLSKKAIETIKEKPLEQRVKSQMTVSEPRVLCVSVFDNGPVHMLDTIHTSAGIITIHKKRWDASTKAVIKKPLRILAIIDEYNHKMDYVDIRDHLSHEYNLDGGFWRDKKWWIPIFKELFKSSCDQGYVMYKRVCEIEEEARKERVAAARQQAGKAAEDAARKKKITDPVKLAAAAAAAAAKVQSGKPIKSMPHLDFLEKIAEGFVIEAYNSTKSRAVDHMHLDAYNLSQIERALAEMRGDEPPSAGAQGQSSPATTATVGKKRNVHEAEVDQDGRLAEHELQGPVPHTLIDAEDAVLLGFMSESYRANGLYCTAGPLCRFARRNKTTKCGEGSAREQSARSKCSSYCMHPRCRRGFHASCHAVVHRIIEFTELPTLPDQKIPSKKQKK